MASGSLPPSTSPKAYPDSSDNGVATRTWQDAIEYLTRTKEGANQQRWRTAARDKAFAPLLPRIIIETPGEVLLNVLHAGNRNEACRHAFKDAAARKKFPQNSKF